ncbi:hypothetical protein CHH27_08095 [Labrenzia sp. VG12]|nr:hypothetical protein CHH27_08095 [Labrenzia sp. VG12]
MQRLPISAQSQLIERDLRRHDLVACGWRSIVQQTPLLRFMELMILGAFETWRLYDHRRAFDRICFEA